MLLLISACQSVQKNNRFLETKIQPEQLKKDVDFTYQKLQKYHPKLYWYISKEQLDYKFDSLRNSISKPLTPNEFYFQLAPVIASIKEGHLRLRSFPKQYSKKEQKNWKNQHPLFGMMDYKIIGNQLFVKENKDHFGKIKIGTEILKINNQNVSDLINRYQKLYSSDGENKTFQKYFMNLAFFNYYTLENGLLDSVKLQTKFDRTISEITLKRQKKTPEQIRKDLEKQKLTNTQKIQDYDTDTKSYNRNLKFLKDSTIAYIRIKSFSGTYAKKFYKASFEKIKKNHSNYLILDIRDNLGGSLSEINLLYSYLADKEFTLIQKPEMTFRSSSLHQNYFQNQSVFSSIFTSVGYPFFLLGNAFFSSKKGDSYYFRERSSKPTKPIGNAFTGKIYVLINGSSFSASSIISAKLKYEKRATIIGEETGGANDGTVAGVNNTITLPYSKLTLPIGLFLIRPNIEFENQKRGVIPDYQIDQDFDNLFSKEDKTLNWTLDKINLDSGVSN